jgi:hypothetical protein
MAFARIVRRFIRPAAAAAVIAAGLLGVASTPVLAEPWQYPWQHRGYGWSHRGYAWNHPGYDWRHRGYAWHQSKRGWSHRGYGWSHKGWAWNHR